MLAVQHKTGYIFQKLILKEMDSNLDLIRHRLLTKKQQYANYNFSEAQIKALWAFFDLAQEYATLESFYRVCVLVPKEFLGFEGRLYILSEEGNLELVSESTQGLVEPPQKVQIPLFSRTTCEGDSCFFPFKGNRRLLSLFPLHHGEETLGVLEILPRENLSEQDLFFFQKFANRIGYNLHVKLLMIQCLEHLKFINELVADIEHNIIIPNMFYRYLFKRLQKKISLLKELEGRLDHAKEYASERIKGALDHLYRELQREYEQIEKHYTTVSLFLESLFRREHFEKGRFVLRKRPCRFAKEVIEPQLERYRKRFEKVGITIDNRLGGVPDEELVMAVDVGLLSQVYANLFSNALKYTQEVINEEGQKVKFISFGREIIPDFFGPGRPGIKFNVFSTGPHIPPQEVQKIFEEGFRGSNTNNQPGTGRGLHFVKKVIELHGGTVGYEPTPLGNNFYFVLPLEEDSSPFKPNTRLTSSPR